MNDPLFVHYLPFYQSYDANLGVENPPQIYTHFNLDQKQVLQCRHWAQAVNIRWGISAKMRASAGLAESDEHSWKYGLERMLLGYMLSGEQLFDDLLPFNQIEGNDAQILAFFKSFTEAIFPLWDWSLQSLEVEVWIEKLRQFIANLFGQEAMPQLVLKALDSLSQQQQLKI